METAKEKQDAFGGGLLVAAEEESRRRAMKPQMAAADSTRASPARSIGSIDQEAPLLRASTRSAVCSTPLKKSYSYSSAFSGDSEYGKNGPSSIFAAQRNGVNVRRLNHKSTSVRHLSFRLLYIRTRTTALSRRRLPSPKTTVIPAVFQPFPFLTLNGRTRAARVQPRPLYLRCTRVTYSILS